MDTMTYNRLLLARPNDGGVRFFTEADCAELGRRAVALARGGGATEMSLVSWWHGSIRWARNEVTLSADQRGNFMTVLRNIRGARSDVVAFNDSSDEGLAAALRRAERLSGLVDEQASADYVMTWAEEPAGDVLNAERFSDATFGLDEETRAKAARELARSAEEAGMLSAGYLEAAAHCQAKVDGLGRLRYVPYTQTRYSVTVRDPRGAGSGWAGDSHWAWAMIDASKLSQLALDKCLKSRNPVRLEPGRYTTVLEPQAVADFMGQLVYASDPLDRYLNELGARPFNKSPQFSKLGERVADERITISTDPTDPELAYPPYFMGYNGFYADVYRPTTWIKNGVLVNLAYDHRYAIGNLGTDTGHPNPGGFRISVTGPTQTVDEMVQSTTRGLLVTRFTNIELVSMRSQVYRGYTRDGLWLVEDGKITKAVKNFRFTESPLFVLNNVEAFGTPQRIFHPQTEFVFAIPQPVIVPAMKVRDFSFTALSDAV